MKRIVPIIVTDDRADKVFVQVKGPHYDFTTTFPPTYTVPVPPDDRLTRDVDRVTGWLVTTRNFDPHEVDSETAASARRLRAACHLGEEEE